MYVHVPFCASICAYCDFAHGVYQEGMADAWLDALEKEIQHTSIPNQMETIYIGGGTPTALSLSQLETLLKLLSPYANEAKEYTIEINPETLTEEKVKLMKSYGINRASVGFQSGEDELLKMMMRHHSFLDTKHTVELLQEYGITDISLDLMYSLPHQTMEMLERSIKQAVSLNPTHLSLYSLTIEENTVFDKKGYKHLDDDTEADMYERISTLLPEYGYQQYEISNFAKEGHQSLHNTAYWHYDDFYGFGLGASGKEGNIRYDHTRNLKAYIADPYEREETLLTKEDQMFEMLMMSLRLKEGMSLSLFENRFGVIFADHFAEALQSTLQKGWVKIKDDHITCTDAGYEIVNEVLIEFLD